MELPGYTPADFSDVRRWQTAGMLMVARFRYAEADIDAALGQATAELGSCVDLLAQHPGFVAGSVGRALDDPTLWLLTISWRDVGSYRRALSSYDVKAQVVPLLSRAIDEPSAYEVLAGAGAAEAAAANEAKPRGSD
jgi:Antibiotic biosynthesis monooxygenase